MSDALPLLLVFTGLVDWAVLYGLHVARRVHQRRIDERLRSAAQLYGLVRITLSERRAA